MRKRFFVPLLSLAFSACLLGGNDENGPGNLKLENKISPGVYRGDYGAITLRDGIESELILRKDGGFRFFQIRLNAPFYITKGNWNATAALMLWSDFAVGSAYDDDGMDFDDWDTLSYVDTTDLRGVSDTAFDRREIVPDTAGVFRPQWIHYSLVLPPSALSDGRYEYDEVYRDYFDTTKIYSGKTFIELTRGGKYRDGRFHDGTPMYEFEGAGWSQAGSFLISRDNRDREYDSESKSFSEWREHPFDYEYVVRVRNVAADSFQAWIPYTFSNQGYEYWATYKRVP